MENRDNIIEEQLKNSVENIPDSLKPNNMEQRLLQMTQEERFSRSMSVDIPDDNETKRLAKSDKSKDKKSGKKKVIIIYVLDAAFFLLLNLLKVKSISNSLVHVIIARKY